MPTLLGSIKKSRTHENTKLRSLEARETVRLPTVGQRAPGWRQGSEVGSMLHSTRGPSIHARELTTARNSRSQGSNSSASALRSLPPHHTIKNSNNSRNLMIPNEHKRCYVQWRLSGYRKGEKPGLGGRASWVYGHLMFSESLGWHFPNNLSKVLKWENQVEATHKKK